MAKQRFNDEARKWPTYWFARLEEAVAAGDTAKRDEAIAELKTLGYEVEHKPAGVRS